MRQAMTAFEEVDLIECNLGYERTHRQNGTEDTVSTRRLAPSPPLCNSDNQTQTQTSNKNTLDVSDNTVPLVPMYPPDTARPTILE